MKKLEYKLNSYLDNFCIYVETVKFSILLLLLSVKKKIMLGD